MKQEKIKIVILLISITSIIFFIIINYSIYKTLLVTKGTKNTIIQYVNSDDFTKNINKLIKLGYSTYEINTFYNIFNNDELNLITSSNYDNDLINYIKLDYFKKENIKRYIDFKFKKNKFSYSFFDYNNDNNLTYEDIVTYVNIGLDQEYYTNVININNPNDLDVIVNKYHKLNSNYEPQDLEEINQKYSSKNQKLRKSAKNSFEKMAKDAYKDGITIYVGSAYRSYLYQEWLYNKHILNDGFIFAETYSARAGHSEHQTGLAVDILNSKWNLINECDEEYEWLINNSYKYGFILRYKKGDENITGYIFEDWHFRYLGNDLATKLYKLNISYEEYIAKYR